jgi:hypothetical protein
MKQSNLWSLNWRDFLRGLIMGVGTPLLYVIQELIPSWPLTVTQKIALSAFVGYLLKNLVTKPDTENKSAVPQNDFVGDRPNDR